MLKYPPSVKAAAAVFLARKYLNIIPYWVCRAASSYP